MTKYSKNTVLSEANFFDVAGHDVKETELSDSKMRSMKERVMNRVLSAAPSGGKTIRQQQRKWKEIAPGISINVIARDLKEKTQTAIWRMKAGAVIPAHSHRKDEECLMLKGVLRIGEHVIGEGDIHLMSAGTEHEQIEAVTDAEFYLKHDICEEAPGFNTQA